MKNLFIFCLFLFTCQSVFAQKFSFGMKGGANYYDWYYSNIKYQRTNNLSQPYYTDWFKALVGGELGVTAKQNIAKRFSLNEEVLFAIRNVKNTYFGTQKNLYLAVPIFVSYNFYKPLSLDLGGEYSRLIDTNVPYAKQFFDDYNFYNGMIGLRYSFLEHFNVHARYVHTFNKISEITWNDFNAEPIGISKLRSRTFNLSVGYNF